MTRQERRERRARAKLLQHRGAQVPMSAMIDVVFLLLIFFLVTFMPQLVEAHMEVRHPRPDPDPPPESLKPPSLTVSVLPDGYVYHGQSTTLTELHSRMLKWATYDRKATLIIRVDPDATEGRVTGLLDVCADVGLVNLNVLTARGARRG